ncbi:MAG: hypothetical protein ACI9CU_002524, partial [Polaribacter sp.]
MNFTLRTFCLVFVLLVMPIWLLAQTQTIRGVVADSEGRMPIIGATVVLVGSDPLVG